MGCNYCHRAAQVVEEFEPKRELSKIKSLNKTIGEFEFDFKKAMRLFKLLLSEDNLYNKILNDILLFNDEQFENLFQGNTEYKHYPYHNITNERIFKYLLLKLENFYPLLYEWYKDETKYNILIKLWRSNLNIYNLSKNPDLEQDLEKMGITDIDELTGIIGNSLESKANDIKNYLKIEDDYFISLIQINNEYKEYFDNSLIQGKKTISQNFKNINKKLIEESLPLIKAYIKEKYPNLNAASRNELETKMRKKLRDSLLNEIINDKESPKKKVGYKVISELNEILNGLKTVDKVLNIPALGHTITIATSFLNLATSIVTFYEESVEYDEQTQKFEEKFDIIHQKFEMHTKEIENLDLDDYDGCIKKIKIIGSKIKNDKKECSQVINQLISEREETEKSKKKKIIKGIVVSGVSIAVGGLTLLTGGLAAPIIAGIGIGANSAALGINIGRLVKLQNQLKLLKEKTDEAIKKYVEMTKAQEELEKKMNQIRIKDREKYQLK